MKLFEVKSVEYVLPDFNYEFSEVEFQPEVNNYFKTKKKWLEVAKKGRPVTLSKFQLELLMNHDHRFKELDDEKQKRVPKLFLDGKVEMPIVLKDADFWYLLAGNTRLAYARKVGFKPTVWLIDTPGLREYF